jgi:hypothetical protein
MVRHFMVGQVEGLASKTEFIFMAENKMYLTVDREKRKPQNDGYVAVISMGSPQLGDENVVILDVEIVKNMKEAKAWYKRMIVEKPWETRQ